MAALNLIPIPISEEISREEFQKGFAKPNKPVVLKNYSLGWPARKKWTFEYFKSQHADLMVPVYKEAFANSGTSYTSTDNKMLFGDYLDLIATTSTHYRMFLFNIFKHIPSLCNDFFYPDIIDRYLTKYPFMFFGGATSWVDVHYDLDLSHVFLTQFYGKKRVILFGPEYSNYLYRHPLTVSCNIDIGNPDFECYPRLKEAQGYECTLDSGDTLFIPTGYWHYIYYLEGGFALSLRARPDSLTKRLLSGVKIFNLTILDHHISRFLGVQRWYNMKEKMAVNTANKQPKLL
ncbi:MAG: hypothetical protein A3E87_09415 [Gammaproteobacteria bacterium RIFCSPHIGHO2_12_FULL_35_23]|nr:MAG: hypothetical protein A3E87_09415 [Gammaproteobacteria bacterium RIFCSPHIGHO2_12_FULL_35_23]